MKNPEQFSEVENNTPEKGASLKEKIEKTLKVFAASFFMLGGMTEESLAKSISPEQLKQKATKIEQIVEKHYDRVYKNKEGHVTEYEKTVVFEGGEKITVDVNKSGIFVKFFSEKNGEEVTDFIYDAHNKNGKPTGEVKKYVTVKGETRPDQDGMLRATLPEENPQGNSRLDSIESDFEHMASEAGETIHKNQKESKDRTFAEREVIIRSGNKLFFVDYLNGETHQIPHKEAEKMIQKMQTTYDASLDNFEKGFEAEK